MKFEDNNNSNVNRKIAIDEALSCMFQKGWGMKYFGILLLAVPFIFACPIIYTLQIKTLQLKDIPIIALIYSICTLLGCIINGYFMLYAHDRALNKNENIRIWTNETLINAFFTGLKFMIGATINGFLIGIVCFPIVAILVFLNILHILGTIISIILFIVLFCFLINFSVKLYCHFLKDLKLISWFQWIKAWNFNKGCHFGKIEMVLAVLISIGIGILGAIPALIIFVPGVIFNNIILFLILSIIFGPLLILIWYYIYVLFWGNIFGQYVYNAIEYKTGVAPESLSNVINQDKLPAIILGIIVFSFQVLMNTANMYIKEQKDDSSLPNSTYSQTSSRPSMQDLNALILMKKSDSIYEQIAYVYMAKNDKDNLRDMFDSNCSNANDKDFFNGKIKKEVGTCKFIMQDDTYWEINPSNGEAIVSEKENNPKYRIKFGICSNGEPNCESEYPEAYNLMNNNK